MITTLWTARQFMQEADAKLSREEAEPGTLDSNDWFGVADEARKVAEYADGRGETVRQGEVQADLIARMGGKDA